MTDYESEYRLEEQDLRILKNILEDAVIANDFAATYDENIFLGATKDVIKETLSYIKVYKTPPTKRILLERAGTQADKFSTVLEALDEIDGNSIEYQYDLDKLKNRYAETKIWSLREILDQPVEKSEFPQLIDEILSEMEAVKQIQSPIRKTYTQKTLKSFMPDFKNLYAEKVKNPELSHGILTHYSFLDYCKNGFQPSEMCIVGAETGAGKSMLLSNMAIQMWMQKNTLHSKEFTKGHNVLYFSLEMPYEACARRAMARIANVPMYGIRDAKLSSVDFEMLESSTDFIQRYPHEFEIVDIARGATMAQIEARFLEARRRFNPEIVVVDYLGLMEDKSQPGADDWLKLGNIANALHEFARYYGIVLLTAVQLNRIAKSSSSAETIGMHRIGRSSMIMHAADLGIQIESRPNEQEYADLLYHIIKIRDGEMGHAKLHKNFKNASLIDMDYPADWNQSSGSDQTDDLSSLLEKYKWGQK